MDALPNDEEKARLFDLRKPRGKVTEHQIERDLNMIKVKMKISGGFRSEEGAMNYRERMGNLYTPGDILPRCT